MENAQSQRVPVKNEAEEQIVNEIAMALPPPPGFPPLPLRIAEIGRMDKGKTVVEEQMDLQVSDHLAGSSFPPTAAIPSSNKRARKSQSKQERDELKRQKARDASRAFRRRRKGYLNSVQESCKILNLENESLKKENEQLKEKLEKAETDLALFKDKQNEAMKVMASGLRMLED